LKTLYRERITVKKLNEQLPLGSSYWEEALADLNSRGYTILRGYNSGEQCSQIREFIDGVSLKYSPESLLAMHGEQPKFGWPQEEGFSVWTDKAMSDYRIVHSEVANQSIAYFFHDKNLLNIGQCFMNRKLTPKFCMANRTSFRPGNAGSGGGWHRDEVFRRGFKSLMYLVDVNEQNGPFQLIADTQSWGFHLRHKTGAEQYKYTQEFVDDVIKNDPDRLKTITANAGDVLLFETNLIHRGKPVESGTRYAITNYYSFA
jgi:hypothetical protein